MSFDYKALGDQLRAKFAAAQEVVRRVNFEEAIADRNGGKMPTINQRIYKVLHDMVPGVSPAVMTVAGMLHLPRGMVNEHRALDGLPQDARDLYLLMTQQMTPASAALVSPEGAQLTMAHMLVNAEIMQEARATSYVPYAQMQGAAQDMGMIDTLLSQGLVRSGAPALDAAFAAKTAEMKQAAQDFFNAHNKKPPHP